MPVKSFGVLNSIRINSNESSYFFFLPFFLEAFLDFLLALAFFSAFFLADFLLFLSDFFLTFFFGLDLALAAFFFGFEAFLFAFGFVAVTFFLAAGASFFAAAIVALARTGPKPETAPNDSTVLAAIFSADVNPLALSVSAVDRPMPGI